MPSPTPARYNRLVLSRFTPTKLFSVFALESPTSLSVVLLITLSFLSHCAVCRLAYHSFFHLDFWTVSAISHPPTFAFRAVVLFVFPHLHNLYLKEMNHYHLNQRNNYLRLHGFSELLRLHNCSFVFLLELVAYHYFQQILS